MKNWEKKKLGEVCIVERGSSPRPIEKYQTDSSDGVNWIKIGDTKGVEKYIYSTREKITKEGAEKSRYVKEGDFILSNSMSFGKPYIMKTDGYIHDGWFVFRLPDYLDKDYFYHLLTSPNVQEQIQSLGAGAIVKNISGDLVKKVDITFPKSLSEQQRIVAILDEAFAALSKAKANAEQNLKNAKELFESYLQGVFENKGEGWEEKRLEEICVLISKGSSPKWQGIKYVDEPGVLFVTSENVGENTLLLEQRKYVEEKFNISDKKSILKNGDVLTNIVGASIGRTAIFDLDDIANINQAVCLIRCNKEVLFNEYLMYLLNSPFTKQHLHDNEVNNARANLSLGFFRSLSIPLPKLNEQKEVVNKTKAFHIETQKLESIYQQKVNDLEELKKSVLQKAFSGELKTAKACA
jgi:type I restriction enzyme S subunit